MPRRQEAESYLHCLSDPPASLPPQQPSTRQGQTAVILTGHRLCNDHAGPMVLVGSQPPAPATTLSHIYRDRKGLLKVPTWALLGPLAGFPVSDFRVWTPGLSSWSGGCSGAPRHFCGVMVIQGGPGWPLAPGPVAEGGRPFSVGRDTRLSKQS